MQEEQKIIKRPSTFPQFSKYLALQPNTAVQYANQCKKQFEDFNQAFKKRIAIELDYAKNLQIVSKNLDKYIQPGTQKAISFICSAFKVENQQRAHQAKQLAQSLRTQIYQICYQMFKQQSNVVKKVQKDVKKYIKQYQSLREQLQKSQQNYQKVSTQAQQLIITKNLLKHTSEIPQQKKLKLISKTMDSIKQKKQYQKLYTTAFKNYNQFVRQYNKSITQDLNQIQNQIRQQIILQGDCLRKLIVCEVSMFKNIQYDLINISKQMEHLDMQKDIELHVTENQHRTDQLICQLEETKKTIKEKRKSLNNADMGSTISNDQDLNNLLKLKQSELEKGMMAICIKHIEEENFTTKLLNRKNKEFRDLIESRWLQLNPKPVQQKHNVVTAEPKKDQQKQQTEGSQQKIEQKIQQKVQQKAQQPKQKKQVAQVQVAQVQAVLSVQQKFQLYLKQSLLLKQLLKQKSPQQSMQSGSEVYQNILILTRYLNQLWCGYPITPIQLRKKSTPPSQSILIYIKKLLSYHHFYRVLVYLFIEKYQTHHKVMIQNGDRAREIGKVMNALLTKSAKENDVFVLRGIIGLLFTYYWVENNNKKLLYVEPTIYKNSIWKKQDFWDAAIYQSTYEEMINFGAQKGQSIGETVFRQKNSIFTQLASYCHYMIMLGIASKSVRQIVGRYCRLYEMGDEQNKDLSKIITNTVKQYKEVNNEMNKQSLVEF